MKTIHFIALLAFVFLGASGCKPQNENEGTFELQFVPKVAGQTFEPGLIYTSNLGQNYSISHFLMYVSDIALVKEDGSTLALSKAELFDFTGLGKTSHGEGVFQSWPVPAGTYKGIQFSIGVSPTYNHNDPSLLDTNDPLSAGFGMHRNTIEGYNFVKLVGTSPASSNGISYELASDSLFKKLNFSEKVITIKAKDETQAIFEIDLNEIFSSTDFSVTPSTTTFPFGSSNYGRAEQLMNNLVNRALIRTN